MKNREAQQDREATRQNTRQTLSFRATEIERNARGIMTRLEAIRMAEAQTGLKWPERK